MIYESAFADQARAMCRLGATDEELAEHFEVCVRTIYRWRNTHEEFADAVVAGKDHADARVERALYSRAVGCSVERTRVFKSAGDPDPVYATYTHQLPPDANAALQWLRVRQPKKWNPGPKDDDDPGVIAMIERALARVAEGEASRETEARQPPPEAVAPEPGPDAATEPPADPEPDAEPPPDREPAPEPVAEPEPQPEPQPQPEPESDYEPNPPGPRPALELHPRPIIYAPIYRPLPPQPRGYG